MDLIILGIVLFIVGASGVFLYDEGKKKAAQRAALVAARPPKPIPRAPKSRELSLEEFMKKMNAYSPEASPRPKPVKKKASELIAELKKQRKADGNISAETFRDIMQNMNSALDEANLRVDKQTELVDKEMKFIQDNFDIEFIGEDD